MSMMNMKNLGLSPAAVDLGLKIGLDNSQPEETEEEKRKRLRGEGGGVLGSPASMMLFGMGGSGV